MNHRVFSGLSIALLIPLGGCSSYALRGRVVEGDASMVLVVDESDPRLKGPGVPGATVTLVLDPERLSREPAGGGMADGSGEFSISVGEFGAGVLEFDALVTGEAKGFIPAEGMFPLPGQGERVLIMMQRGLRPGRAGENLLDEIRRYQN